MFLYTLDNRAHFIVINIDIQAILMESVHDVYAVLLLSVYVTLLQHYWMAGHDTWWHRPVGLLWLETAMMVFWAVRNKGRCRYQHGP